MKDYQSGTAQESLQLGVFLALIMNLALGEKMDAICFLGEKANKIQIKGIWGSVLTFMKNTNIYLSYTLNKHFSQFVICLEVTYGEHLDCFYLRLL